MKERILILLLLATVCSMQAQNIHMALRPDDLLIDNFEGDTFGNWILEGNAFGNSPVSMERLSIWGDNRFEGNRMASSFVNGDAGTGVLKSPLFRIERRYVNFLIGGGVDYQREYVALWIDGKEVKRSTGYNRRVMEYESWDVAEYMGKNARIVLVDQSKEGWGFINADCFYQSDTKLEKEIFAKRMLVTHRYLNIPVKMGAVIEQMDIWIGDKMVRNMEVELGVEVMKIEENNRLIESLADRISGRCPLEDVVNPQTGEIIAKKNVEITDEQASEIEKYYDRLKIRSMLTCHSAHGVCAKCYGRNLATGRHVEIGEAVGIIAAQSIGEPGTQLTMRTFHTGGVASAEDITQGLPRVEELFEARKPKGNAIISKISGTVSITSAEDNPNVKIITISNDEQSESEKIPVAKKIIVQDGQHIEAGTRLFEGNINPHDILEVLGVQATQDYIVNEVQKVYRSQGVEINDKHIEVIAHQMLRKIKIIEPGDSGWLPGEVVDIVAYRGMNGRLEDEGKKPSQGINLLLGTTKAALATDSFLSAASFQETTRVLTEAAIKGKEDPLLGLKENVIIGKLIPAGTGMSRYRKLKVVHNAEPPAPAEKAE